MKLEIIKNLEKRNQRHEQKMFLTDLAELTIAPTPADEKMNRQEIRQKRYRALWRLMAGKTQNISLVTLEKLCKALEVTPNQLLNYKTTTK